MTTLAVRFPVCTIDAIIADTRKDVIPIEADESSYETTRVAFVPILDAIRRAVLKWTLELEEAGILGDGLTFSEADEKKAAEQAPKLYQHFNFILAGVISHAAVQQGSPDASQRQE